MKYIRGHGWEERGDVHLLSDFDIPNRRAACSRCGIISIKKDKVALCGWKCTGTINLQHRLTEINVDTKRGWCTGCLGEVDIVSRNPKQGTWKCKNVKKLADEKDRTLHKEKRTATMKKWNKENGRNWRLQNKYGITEADYNTLLVAQDGVCAICKNPPSPYSRLHHHLVVDHCHITEASRGLLCNQCNRVLGMVNDDPIILQAMIDYLAHWKSSTSPS